MQRVSSIDNPALISWAIDNQEIGRMEKDRAGWLERLLKTITTDRRKQLRQRLMGKLGSATTDDERQRLLREIQDLDRAPATAAGRPSP